MSKSVRIDDDVLERIMSDAPGKTLSDKLRGLMARPASAAPEVAPASNSLQAAQLNRLEDKLDQLLELGASLPVEVYPPGANIAPASIPGVQRGPRESSFERAAREKRRQRTGCAAWTRPTIRASLEMPSLSRGDK